MNETNDITKYDKISDMIYRLAANIVLKFNVSFSRNDKNGSRRFGYSEYVYKSQKYDQNLVSIKRDNDFYLSIESIPVMGNISSSEKVFIRIGITEMPKLIAALQVCDNWIRRQNLFIKNGAELVVADKNLSYAITNLPMNKYLLFTPCIIQTGGESQFDNYPGISIELGSKGQSIGMPIDRFMAFKYIIDNFNLYESYSIMMLQLFESYNSNINQIDMTNERRELPYNNK